MDLIKGVRRWRAGLNFLASSALAILLMGCGMEHEWVEEMIEEMGKAYGQADEMKLGYEAREAAVARAVQNYFRPGMNKEAAFELLRQLKESGFRVGEYRHEGGRGWPHGNFKPYVDEATRGNLQSRYRPGYSWFSATLHLRSRLVVDEFVAVGFKVKDGSNVISDVDANVSATFL